MVLSSISTSHMLLVQERPSKMTGRRDAFGISWPANNKIMLTAAFWRETGSFSRYLERSAQDNYRGVLENFSRSKSGLAFHQFR